MWRYEEQRAPELSTLSGNVQYQSQEQYSPTYTITKTNTYSPSETYAPTMNYSPSWNIQYESPNAMMTTKKTIKVTPELRTEATKVMPAVSAVSAPSQAQTAEAKSSGGLLGGALPIVLLAGLAVGGLYLLKR